MSLKRAQDHIFIAGIHDLGTTLCAQNAAFGLAKIHFLQEKLGLKPNATFIGAPDATITRNINRWKSGFGYGGMLNVPSEQNLAILDSKPNACGMLVGKLDQSIDSTDVIAKTKSLKTRSLYLDGVKLEYDLAESNHFIDICQLDPEFDHSLDNPPNDIFVIHSSGHEHRRVSPLGPGLYIDESLELKQMTDTIQTPWGLLHYLQHDDALAYYRFALAVQDFNKRRRELYAHELFGSFTPWINATHQGFRKPGMHYLGAYFFEDSSELFPLTLGPDQFIYIIQPQPNYSNETIEQLGWWSRAEQLDLLPQLKEANILPHGGGYLVEGKLLSVQSNGDQRIYQIEDDDGKKQITNIKQIPVKYRGEAVIEHLIKQKLGKIVARYRIKSVIKS